MLMRSLGAIWLACMSGGPALAQDGAPVANLNIELNKVDQVESGCQLTLLASSTYPQGVDQVVIETVLFDSTGAVNRMTLFDFGTIPANLPRVRQFVIPTTSCEDISRILINGVHHCAAAGLDKNACAAGLTVSNRTDLEMLG